MNDAFRLFAHRTSLLVASAYAFGVAILVVLVWALSGPLFGFSDTWQLVINTGTTIVTFLMVFLIQNTQNRDSRAVHLKLDELILYTHNANNELVNTENFTDEQLQRLEQHFQTLGRALGKGEAATDGDEASEAQPRAAKG
jgi:low affinity Fe/Cu permease